MQNITTEQLLDILSDENAPFPASAEPVIETDKESQLIQPEDIGMEAPDTVTNIYVAPSSPVQILSPVRPPSAVRPPSLVRSPSPVQPPSPVRLPSPVRSQSPPVSDTLTFTQLIQKERSWSTNIENQTFPVYQTKTKPTIDYNNRHLPIDYFEHMFTSNIIDILVENTILYAIKNQTRNWIETNNEEMRALLGVIIMMGLKPLTDVELYWSTDDFYNNPVISGVMTLKRYKKLIENFHVNNPNTELERSDPNYDKLAKVRPLIGILNHNFSSMCSQSSSQSIDESMVKFKGLLP